MTGMYDDEMSEWQLELEEDNNKPQGIVRIQKWTNARELIFTGGRHSESWWLNKLAKLQSKGGILIRMAQKLF